MLKNWKQQGKKVKGMPVGHLEFCEKYRQLTKSEQKRLLTGCFGIDRQNKSELKPKDSGTQLLFDHIGFPKGLKVNLSLGWQQHYWDALNKFLH